MAVDIVLVLRSEHRHIQQLIDRCGRASRGFHDPAAELHQALRAHVLAATAEIYPTAAKACDPQEWPAERLTSVRTLVERDRIKDSEAKQAAEDLVGAEESSVIPSLEGLELAQRRRLGKVFRIRRDALARQAAGSRRRRRSQTELYELARRAGVEHRSRMTQAELQAAIEARGIEA
jgi:hypothetical protein